MIIVTGSSGFIGSCLMADLARNGFGPVIAVDTNPSHSPYASMFMHTDNLRDFLLLTTTKVDAVFHLGAMTDTQEMDIEMLTRINTDYSCNLFAACADLGIPFIYASSAAVYGNSRTFDDRRSDYTPLNPYGWSKLNIDRHAKNVSTKGPPRWAGLRLFNVYGPNEYHKGPMSSMALSGYNQLKETGTVKLFADPDLKMARDFIYVKDVTRMMIEAWKAPKFENGIYNIGTGVETCWAGLTNAVASAMGLKEYKSIDIDMPEKLKNRYQHYTKADMSKWLSQGLKGAQYDLNAGITDYVQNYLAKGMRSW